MTPQQPVYSTESSAIGSDKPPRVRGLLDRGEIVHDLSNWLCCIDMLANSIPRDGSPREDLDVIVAQLRDSTSEAIELCRELLDGRSDTSENPSPAERPMKRLNPGELLNELRPLMNVFIPDTATLHWAVDDFVPVIFGNSTQLKRVVVNLVKNASEALRDGRREITVRGKATELRNNPDRDETEGSFAPGQCVVIEISDTGCGMDEETVHNIFRSSFTSKSSRGHGLGLASVKDIVEQHQGWIQVQSAPGRGTTVRTYLPCLPAGSPDEPDDSEVGNVDHDLGRQILVVDDQRTLRTVTARLLATHGFDVATAESAEQAVEILTQPDENFSAIVTDLRLPGISGRNALTQLRLICPDIPIIVMTGCTEEETDEEFCDGYRPDAVIRKPFDIQAMLTVIRTVDQRPNLATPAADG